MARDGGLLFSVSPPHPITLNCRHPWVPVCVFHPPKCPWPLCLGSIRRSPVDVCVWRGVNPLRSQDSASSIPTLSVKPQPLTQGSKSGKAKPTALELFLAQWPWLTYDDRRKWPNTESLPLTSLLRTMRSHTLQTDWSARHSPSQWCLWGLRHHNVPLCPSTCVSGC